MHVPERAAQVWPLLAWAAHNRQVLTYDIVGRLIGVGRSSVGGYLGPIQAYCRANRLPPLQAIVVRGDTGLPGEGFTAAADVPRAQADVFRYDWLEAHSPSPEELESAAASLTAEGIPSPS